MVDCSLDSSVPDWIIDHPETETVFQEFGIDTSCGGKSLVYLCDDLDLDPHLVLTALHSSIAARRVSQGGSDQSRDPSEP